VAGNASGAYAVSEESVKYYSLNVLLVRILFRTSSIKQVANPIQIMNNYNSNIYWHFTGSPDGVDWAALTMPKEIIKEKKPKSTEKAWCRLAQILASKKLLATAQEKLYGFRATEKFCCVTDIPMNNLHKHKEFYGDVAVGFRSEAIHREFNPVLYIPKVGIIKAAIVTEEGVETWTRSQMEAEGIDRETAKRSRCIPNDDESEFSMPYARVGYKENTKLEKHLLNYLKFTKHSCEPGESFYQEREWRCIGDFWFEYSDIAAIIVPKKLLGDACQKLNELGITEVSVFS